MLCLDTAMLEKRLLIALLTCRTQVRPNMGKSRQGKARTWPWVAFTPSSGRPWIDLQNPDQAQDQEEGQGKACTWPWVASTPPRGRP